MTRSARVLQTLHVFFGPLTRNNVCLEKVHSEAELAEIGSRIWQASTYLISH